MEKARALVAAARLLRSENRPCGPVASKAQIGDDFPDFGRARM